MWRVGAASADAAKSSIAAAANPPLRRTGLTLLLP
jgi:hypothetical protein